MRKILWAVLAVIVMAACSGEREYIQYRGHSMGMSAKAMVDSLLAEVENLAVDTNKSGENNIVLVDTMMRNFSITVYQQNDTISDILENYVASYNDSTSNLWQRMHDDLEKEFGWPDMKHQGDLHKEAIYDNKKGTVVLILLNTYSPTLSVRYSTMTAEK